MTTAPDVTPTDAQVIALAIENRLIDVFVGMPCTVEKYYPDQQAADLLPRMPRVLTSRAGKRFFHQLPVLPVVPVLFPGGNGVFQKFALEKGDPVLAFICDRDIGPFLTSPTAQPVDDLVHGLSGAVCFPVSFKQEGRAPVTDGIAVGVEGGGELYAHDNGVELRASAGTPAADSVALASKVDALWDAFVNTEASKAPDSGAAIQTAVRAAYAAMENSVASKVSKSD